MERTPDIPKRRRKTAPTLCRRPRFVPSGGHEKVVTPDTLRVSPYRFRSVEEVVGCNGGPSRGNTTEAEAKGAGVAGTRDQSSSRQYHSFLARLAVPGAKCVWLHWARNSAAYPWGP